MAFVPSPYYVRTRRSVLSCSANAPPAAEGHVSKRVALWRQVGTLRRSLERAVTDERYGEAAQLRDSIEELTLTDDYVRAQRQLESAVSEERFRDAAIWRDTLATLTPPPESDEAISKQRQLQLEKETWSETKSHGIVVRVDSYLMTEQSGAPGNYLFGYKVRITNRSRSTCQLVTRRWIITAGSDEKQVTGMGVVGRQPVLEPGDVFEYTSACPVGPVESPHLLKPGDVVASMKGEYLMVKGDTGGVNFRVQIDPFYFKIPQDDRDRFLNA